MNGFQDNLTTAPISKLIWQIALPASVGFFFNTMYNVVDTFWAGRVSTTAIAALSLSFPVFFMIIALGSGVSSGATALISNYLGQKDERSAKKIGVQSVYFSAIISFFLSIFGITTSEFFLRILGASGEYLEIGKSYINIIFLGTVFFLFSFVLNSQLNSRGNTKIFRNLLIGGFFLNIVLDPWFIFGGWGFPALGVAGVAWSTVLIQVISSVYMLYKVLNYKFLEWKDFWAIKPDWKIFKEIARQGFPASINMMSIALGVFVITYFISKFGQDVVAAYGIATRIDQLAVLPSIGLNVATLTLVGQNFGARKLDRVDEVIRKNLKYGLILASVGVAGVLVFGKHLMALFTSDTAIINYGVEYFRIMVFAYWGYIIINITSFALQGLKKPAFVMVVALARQLILPLPIFYLLADVLGLGLGSLWRALLLVIWLASGIIWLYTNRALKKIGAEEII